MINLSFLGATKAQILLLLRRAPRTIHELAESLQLTDNAVRAHVAALERDRLVAPAGRRPRARKPAVSYTLAPSADQMFAKPYPQVLGALIAQVKRRHGAAEAGDALRAIGAGFARERLGRVAGLGEKARIEAVAGLIDDLGGLAEVEGDAGRYILTGYSCPLVAVVGDHPEACQLTGAFVAGLIGEGTVRECCRRAEDATCRFEIDLTASETPGPS
jgi:predicted ArsR family transcriptional regulator